MADDVVVSLAAPNNQNIDGVARMARTLRRPETLAARDQRKLDTIIVPTRVDPSELGDLAKFRERFERLADEKHTAPEDFKSLGKAFWDLQIPYRAKFSYHERRVVGPGSVADPTNGLEQKPDDMITQQDFIDLVERIETEFLTGIQANLRMRLAANPFFNLMTFFRRGTEILTRFVHPW